jgi:hypothetical protein
MAVKKGKRGAPKGHLNSLKNGSNLKPRRLTVGELPLQLIAVRREGRAYRRALEAAVVQAKGEVSVLDAHHIDTASAATIQAGICRWLLRHKFKTMSTSDVMACSNQMTKAKAARDAAVRLLGLDIKPEPMTLDRYVLQAKSKGDAA